MAFIFTKTPFPNTSLARTRKRFTPLQMKDDRPYTKTEKYNEDAMRALKIEMNLTLTFKIFFLSFNYHA